MKQYTHINASIPISCIAFFSVVTALFIYNNRQFQISKHDGQIKKIVTDAIPNHGAWSVISTMCSGSSAANRFAVEMLNAHGIQTQKLNNYEQLVKKKNHFYYNASKTLKELHGDKPGYQEVIIEAMKNLKQHANANGSVLYFKTNVDHVLDKKNKKNKKNILSPLVNMGIVFGHSYRENILDHKICTVTDCFDQQTGYLVYDNGNKSDLCFKRRKHPDIKLKVHLNPWKLVKQLKARKKKLNIDIKNFKQLIAPAESQSTEAMFAYEYTADENAFRQSLKAWASISRSMLDIDENILENLMRKYQNTRTPPGPHSSIIENYDEVVRVLKKTVPPMDSYLRF